MEILFIYSDLQQAPSWGCRSWYPKACLAAWRWGFYPSLPTNLLFTLGLLLFLSELKFPICETNVTSHRFGNRSQKGWAGFKGTHQPWFVKWISKCAGPSAVWTPDVVLAGEGFEKFHYLSTYSFFFFFATQQVFDAWVCTGSKISWVRQLERQNLTPSWISCRYINSSVCNSTSHYTPLSLFPFLLSEDSAFPTNHWMAVEVQWDNICANAFKVERINI